MCIHAIPDAVDEAIETSDEHSPECGGGDPYVIIEIAMTLLERREDFTHQEEVEPLVKRETIRQMM